MGFLDKLFGSKEIPAPTPEEFDKDIFMEFVKLLSDDAEFIARAEQCAENPRKTYKDSATPNTNINGLSHKEAAWYVTLTELCNTGEGFESGNDCFDADEFSEQIEDIAKKRGLPFDENWFDALNEDENTDYMDYIALVAEKWTDCVLPAFDVEVDGICVVGICKKSDFARVKEIAQNYFGKKLVE